jgi:hypothetical protein
MGRLLDFVIGIDKWHIQQGGQAPPKAGLAHAHHAHQNDGAVDMRQNRGQMSGLCCAFGKSVIFIHCRVAYTFANRRRKHGMMQVALWAVISRILDLTVTIRRDGGKSRVTQSRSMARSMAHWGWWLLLAILLAGAF